jgi:2-keto-4-pentenoate hydratase/2-oxohepta-3-ene-1,7-dioic acid hydratase in catechol pathway
VIGPWQYIGETEKNLSRHFRLEKNGKIVQEGDTSLMIYQANQIIHYISQFFTLQTGDLIFTGTPKGVGPIQIGDRYMAFLGNQEILNFEIK